jgi:hypothetical protein
VLCGGYHHTHYKKGEWRARYLHNRPICS